MLLGQRGPAGDTLLGASNQIYNAKAARPTGLKIGKREPWVSRELSREKLKDAFQLSFPKKLKKSTKIEDQTPMSKGRSVEKLGKKRAGIHGASEKKHHPKKQGASSQ